MGATFKDKVGAFPNPDDEFGIVRMFSSKSDNGTKASMILISP